MGIVKKLQELNSQDAGKLGASLADVVQNLLDLDPEQLEQVHAGLDAVADDILRIASTDTTIKDVTGTAGQLKDINEELAKMRVGLNDVLGSHNEINKKVKEAIDQYNEMYRWINGIKNIGPINLAFTFSTTTTDDLSGKFAADQNFVRAIADSLRQLEARK